MANFYKTGLYIKDQKVDVEDNSLFLFKYSNIDAVNPQAIKNAYSKTIKLKGTSNNNKIFNNLWKLDTTLHTSSGLFNPMIRNPFEIYDNGNLIEAGYVQLNNIKYVKNDPVYEITLFGMLGDFFYKLMYKDDNQETEMSLADLKYDFYKINTNTALGEAELDNGINVPSQNINELIEPVNDAMSNVPIISWDKNYIWNSWLCSFTDKYDNVEHMLWEKFITAVPLYNGYHDDFDNNKVLINNNYPNVYSGILPTTFTKDNDTFVTRFNYSLLESQRDMDEWEIRDIRSTFQRPAIRFGTLMQKICDYSAEQGYRIKFDEDIDITNTKPQNFSELNDYFWRSYILLDSIEFRDEKLDETNTVDIQGEWNSIDNVLPVEYIMNPATQTNVFDLRNYSNPSIEINITDEYRPYYFNDPNYITPAIKKVNGGYNASTTVAHGPWTRNNVFGAFIYLFEVEVNGTIDNSLTKVLYVSVDNFGTNSEITGVQQLNEKLLEYSESTFGTTNYELLTTTTINAVRPSDDYHFMIYDKPVKTYINNLPEEQSVKIRLTKDYIQLYTLGDVVPIEQKDWYFATHVHPSYTQGNKFIICNADADGTLSYWRHNYNKCLSKNYAADFKNNYYITSAIFSGAQTSMKNKMVSKNDLLGNTSSPFKYLVDWCKLFNLRFRTDILTKTIYIEQLKNYFIPQVVDINDKIDYHKDFNIDPVYVENNVYKFTLEKDDNESYAKYIYDRAFNDDYSTKSIFTNYSFNNEPLDLFEDNVYNVNIDYMLASPYFNTTLVRGGVQYPPMCLMPKYEYYLWNRNSLEQSESETLYGLQSYNTLPKLDDYFTKQCLFDKEYKPISSNNSLVLFDGIQLIPQNTSATAKYFPYMITDEISLMDDLNDGNSCFLNSYYDDSATPYTPEDYWIKRTSTGYYNKNNQTGVIGLWSFFLPIIHASARTSSNIFDKSYYFSEPNTNNTDAYFGKTTWTNNAGMYSKWWTNYESDVLDKDSKTVTCHVFLQGSPSTAIRKFYWFKNTIWSLLEINDYNFKNTNNDPVKCKFIKVKDLNNYIYNYNAMSPDEPEEPDEPVTDQDLYKCQYIVRAYGAEPFTPQDLEQLVTLYYEEWRDYQPNIDLFNEIINNITPDYVTNVHTIEKSMFLALNTSGWDLDAEDKWMIETYGEVIVIPANG